MVEQRPHLNTNNMREQLRFVRNTNSVQYVPTSYDGPAISNIVLETSRSLSNQPPSIANDRKLRSLIMSVRSINRDRITDSLNVKKTSAPTTSTAPEMATPVKTDTPKGASEVWTPNPVDLYFKELTSPLLNLADANAENAIYSQAENSQRRTALKEVLKKVGLTKRELLAVKIRFGLVDGEHKTLKQTGAELGVTRERARQLESEALGKLRKSPFINELRDYLS